jgi:hypothetical protein
MPKIRAWLIALSAASLLAGACSSDAAGSHTGTAGVVRFDNKGSRSEVGFSKDFRNPAEDSSEVVVQLTCSGHTDGFQFSVIPVGRRSRPGERVFRPATCDGKQHEYRAEVAGKTTVSVSVAASTAPTGEVDFHGTVSGLPTA